MGSSLSFFLISHPFKTVNFHGFEFDFEQYVLSYETKNKNKMKFDMKAQKFVLN